MQRLCHAFDMNFGGSLGSPSVIPDGFGNRYLVSSLMEEAISSSQMEGAVTTRKVAKEMLRNNSEPRNRSERMIVNNYTTIKFIAENKNEELTPDMLLHIHGLMTAGTLTDSNDEGHFRTNNDVVVENAITHEVVHTPPPFTDIPDFVNELCEFANTDTEREFIHPVIKAAAIHFMVAFVHPFVDGNGRTARALFYWYMLRKGYWLTEYLSISRIIYRSKVSYERSFLHTEQDGGDMGYFISYNLRALDLSFKELKRHIQAKLERRKAGAEFMLTRGISERQAEILSYYRNDPDTAFSVKDVEARFGVSQPTARLDLDGLVQMGLLRRIPVNKVKSRFVRSDKFEELSENLGRK